MKSADAGSSLDSKNLNRAQCMHAGKVYLAHQKKRCFPLVISRYPEYCFTFMSQSFGSVTRSLYAESAGWVTSSSGHSRQLGPRGLECYEAGLTSQPVVVDEVASVLDPLLDLILGFVEDGIHALGNIRYILFGDTEHGLRVVWWDCKCYGDDSKEGQECDFHPR